MGARCPRISTSPRVGSLACGALPAAARACCASANDGCSSDAPPSAAAEVRQVIALGREVRLPQRVEPGLILAPEQRRDDDRRR